MKARIEDIDSGADVVPTSTCRKILLEADVNKFVRTPVALFASWFSLITYGFTVQDDPVSEVSMAYLNDAE